MIVFNELLLYLLQKSDGNDEEASKNSESICIMATPPLSMPGHTGYLTSATLPPAWTRST